VVEVETVGGAGRKPGAAEARQIEPAGERPGTSVAHFEIGVIGDPDLMPPTGRRLHQDAGRVLGRIVGFGRVGEKERNRHAGAPSTAAATSAPAASATSSIIQP